MAIADLDAYKVLWQSPKEVTPVGKVAITTVAGRLYSTWSGIALNGAAPSSAIVPTNATAGSLGQADGTDLRILGARLSSVASGSFILADRLAQSGSLVANTASTQTTNLPTAALTRYTSGIGVMMGLEVGGGAQIGSTPTTVTVSYTNTASASGRTSPAIAIGGTGFRESQRFFQLPLQQGDLGVLSVESVTLAATTGTAGTLSVILYKPLVAFVVERPGGQVLFTAFDGGMSGGFEQIVNGSCLFWLHTSNLTSVSLNGLLNFCEV